jgi:hypothetical protein
VAGGGDARCLGQRGGHRAFHRHGSNAG